MLFSSNCGLLYQSADWCLMEVLTLSCKDRHRFSCLRLTSFYRCQTLSTESHTKESCLCCFTLINPSFGNIIFCYLKCFLQMLRKQLHYGGPTPKPINCIRFIFVVFLCRSYYWSHCGWNELCNRKRSWLCKVTDGPKWNFSLFCHQKHC